MSRINTNISALNALKSLNDVNARLSVSQLRLATGKRINSAADDAAGFSIAKKFNARSQGLGQALSNIGSAKNLMAVAEGHLNNILDILTQMKTKATQAADDSLGSAERNAIKSELNQLAVQIDLEVAQATWNSNSIFGGANATSGSASSVQFKFQIGAGSSSTNDVLSFDLLAKTNVSFDSGATNKNYTSSGLNVSIATTSVASNASARALMSNIDTAIEDVSEALSYIGSVVNRLTYQETSLTVARTNTDAARSRIEDADMAYEQLEATKLQILQQTASAMLAQANTSPQIIMQLFQG
ncbi:flagellin [Candidatus Kuenenia sp.]|uniref:flagellin n=1 Tax=Candidatus Kuenenia sp. TaxID=2499824 RepID=UPI00322072F9